MARSLDLITARSGTETGDHCTWLRLLPFFSEVWQSLCAHCGSVGASANEARASVSPPHGRHTLVSQRGARIHFARQGAPHAAPQRRAATFWLAPRPALARLQRRALFTRVAAGRGAPRDEAAGLHGNSTVLPRQPGVAQRGARQRGADARADGRGRRGAHLRGGVQLGCAGGLDADRAPPGAVRRGRLGRRALPARRGRAPPDALAASGVLRA
eukprot:7301227-Prymnesium_polylepis.1